MSTPRGEFEIIRDVLRPLAKQATGALNLTDDAAFLPQDPLHDLVLTQDTLVAGVHFFADDPADLVARKALRVNLSDLAAKGAHVKSYLMSCVWPSGTTDNYIEQFARGLMSDQSEFGLSLLGGDTVVSGGEMTITITAIGEVPKGQMILRSGAVVGDGVFVTGTLGDSSLGLKLRRENAENAGAADRNYLIERYLLPRPRTSLGVKLCRIANAAIDLSDGLAADAAHIAESSGIAMTIYLDRLPLSDAARNVTSDFTDAVCGGDDYEILFTAPKSAAKQLAELSTQLNLPITCIGDVIEGNAIRFLDGGGSEVRFDKSGYQHNRPAQA